MEAAAKMGWFDEQIRQRSAEDERMFRDSLKEAAGAVMGNRQLPEQDDRVLTADALEKILRYYHLETAEIPDKINILEEQLEYVMRSNFSDVSEPEKKSTPLFHAVAGSVFVQEHFGIDDPEIIRAIRYHTVACGNMDKLSQIIYIADLISEDRDYKDVKKMRKYAEQGLEKAMLEALKFSIADSVGKENTIPFLTFESYHYFLNIKKEAKYGSN